VKEIINLFKALGDETRLKILILLSEKKFCAKGISEHLEISQSAVSQHLKILKSSNIIEGKKVGYQIYYTVIDEPLIRGKEFISEILDIEILKKSGNRRGQLRSIDWDIPDKCSIKCKYFGEECNKD